MLKHRSLQILKQLMGTKTNTIESLQSVTGVTRRQIEYNIDLINDWLQDNHLNPVVKGSSSEIILNNDVNVILNRLADQELDYVFNGDERIKLLYLYLFIKSGYTSLQHLIELLDVSRGTALEDIKKLATTISASGLSVEYTRSGGYELIGSEDQLIRVMMKVVIKLVLLENRDYIFNRICSGEEMGKLDQIKKQLLRLSSESSLVLSPNNATIIVYCCYLCLKRGTCPKEKFEFPFQFDIEKTTEYKIATEISSLFGVFGRDNTLLLTSLLLSYSTTSIPVSADEQEYIQNIILKIIERLNYSYGICIDSKSIFERLYFHFRPVVFRLIFNYPMFNPIKNDIREKFESLYNIIHDLIGSYDFGLANTIADDEIAYLTIHFASHIHYDEEKPVAIKKALLVCPNGVGVSLLLFNELKDIFPFIDFINLVSMEELDRYIDDVDMVFSTIFLELDKPLFIVNPIMSEFEKSNLYLNVKRSFNIGNQSNKNPQIDDLMEIIGKYAEINNEYRLRNELVEHFALKVGANGKRSLQMLKDVISEELVNLKVNVANWKEAIQKSSEPLLKHEFITQNYIDEMIGNVEENGPYIVIAPGIALPHARPASGAKKMGISIVTLKNEVEFGHRENDPVKFIFCLSAIDNHSHIDVLSNLITLLNDESFSHILLESNNSREVVDFIKNCEI